MGWDVAEPFDAGGFEGDVRIQASSHRLVDDRLPLLLQQRNQLPLRLNIPPHPPVHIIQIARNGGLFMERWEGE